MNPNPFISFAKLNDAMSRLTALLGMMDRDPEMNGARAAELYISQAVNAHAELARADGVIDQIGAFLMTLPEGSTS